MFQTGYETMFGTNYYYFAQAQQRLAMQDNTTGISPLLNSTPQPTVNDRMKQILGAIGLAGIAMGQQAGRVDL